jgi:DNA-binding CsgD family transcriptional regulator/PAS domain-containing protein
MTKVTIDAVSSLIGQIYEAAYDQERWLEVVKGFEAMFSGSRACIVRFSPNDDLSGSAIASVADPEFTAANAAELHYGDPLLHVLVSLPPGVVFRRTDMHDEAAFRRRALWQDWFRPRDMYGGVTCKLHSSTDAGWFIDVQRGKRQEEFSPADLALFQKFMPHVARAGQIGEQFERKTALADTFSHLPFGVMLVDRRRRILQINEAAEAMLARPDGPLRALHNVIAATSAKDTQALERLVQDSCSVAAEAFPGLGGSIIVPSERANLHAARTVLSISPFPNAKVFGIASERCAVIMMRKVSLASPKGFDQQLRALFALTAAEAKIASSLASGMALKQAAEASSIRLTTARGYLEEVFRKTGTNKQGQLVALLKNVQPLRND